MDNSGYVRPSAHDGLQRWSVQNNLGKIVYDVIAGVIAPATPLATNSSSSNTNSNYPNNNNNNNSGSIYPNVANSNTSPRPVPQALAPPTQKMFSNPNMMSNSTPNLGAGDKSKNDFELPPVPSNFPELANKTVAQLEQITRDENHLLLFCEDVEYIRSLVALRDAAREANGKQAEENMARKGEIDRVRNDLIKAIDELESMKKEYEVLRAKQKEVMQKHSPQSLLAMLKREAAKTDKESEDYSESFLNGNVPLKEFLSNYLEKRTQYHVRAAKAETIQRTL